MIWESEDGAILQRCTHTHTHTDTMKYYSLIKREHFGSVELRWMKPRACYTERSQTEREKQVLYISIYIWNLEKWKDEPICRAGIEMQT